MIRKVRAGSGTAWTQLVGLFGECVFSQIRRAKIQPADAADISQDVFQAVVAGIDEYRHDAVEHGSFRRWLWGITRNKIADYRRTRSRQPRTGVEGFDPPWVDDDVTESASASDAAEGEFEFVTTIRGLAAVVENVRHDFTPQTWRVFWRVVMHDEMIADVARDVGMTATAARQAKYRVAMRLRDELDRLYYGESTDG